MRAMLFGLGVVGALLYASLFALTFVQPTWVEQIGADFIEAQVHEQVDEQTQRLLDVARQRLDGAEGVLATAAKALQRSQAERIEQLRASLQAGLHERVADTIAKARNLDCECRQRWAAWLKEGFELKIGDLQLSSARLGEFVHARYASVVAELQRDLRIFAGSNALIFALLAAAALFRAPAAVPLLLPAGLLALAGLICSWFYLFEQNWFLTLVYQDWLGWGYLAYLGLVFAFLLDVFANRARATVGVLDGCLSAVGSTLQIGPC